MKKLASITLSLAFAIAFAACSDPEPVDETQNGELTDSDPRVQQDNSPYDEYTFEAGEGWTVDAEMRSDVFDTYLWLIRPDGTAAVQVDDNSRQDTNSTIHVTTDASGTFTLRANSYDGNGRGAYTLHYTANPGN